MGKYIATEPDGSVREVYEDEIIPGLLLYQLDGWEDLPMVHIEHLIEQCAEEGIIITEAKEIDNGK